MTIHEVRVARPKPLRRRRGDTISSAIAKERIASASVHVGEVNLAGDDQADRSVHGGPDKAVYLYPREHYAGWQADGFDLDPGGVGENLVATGALEAEVRIGSTWSWGDAVLQVTQPRTPCFKLSLRVGRNDVGPRMLETRRVGWYLRVLRPGPAPTSGSFVPMDTAPTGPTVADALLAVLDPGAADPAVVELLLNEPALAGQWRDALVARRSGGGTR